MPHCATDLPLPCPQAPTPAPMSSNLQPQAHRASSRGAPTLLDMPAGVLQYIMALALQIDESSEWPLPKDGSWRGSALARR